MANSFQLDCVPINGVDNAMCFSDNAVRKQKLRKNIILVTVRIINQTTKSVTDPATKKDWICTYLKIS